MKSDRRERGVTANQLTRDPAFVPSVSAYGGFIPVAQ